jgi:hypothetical protein
MYTYIHIYSDVWGFGVVMWQLLSAAAIPHYHPMPPSALSPFGDAAEEEVRIYIYTHIYNMI